MKFLGEGTNARVYYEDGLSIKKYFNYIEVDNRISKEMFEYLKSIKNKHFINLNSYNLELVPDGKYDYIEGIGEYTYEYVPIFNYKKISNLQDYLLTNFFEIESLIELLTNEGIKIYDLGDFNSILTEENIVIIDPDFFTFSDTAEKNLKHNKTEALNLFVDIMSKFYYMTAHDKMEIFDESSSKDITSAISKKIKYLKK